MSAFETSYKFGTDLIFWRDAGVVGDRGDYLVVETPASPDYYFGNLLVMDRPPEAGDAARWRALFRHSFSHNAAIRHETFEWTTPDGRVGEVADFERAGFEIERNVALVARELLAPVRPNREVEMRPLSSDGDWEQMIENQVACRSEGWPEAAFRAFARGSAERYRKLSARGRGAWWGAFAGDRLVGDLGVFWEGALGRFQNVGTHPDWRRKGICATLVHAASLWALERFPVEALVMVADPDYHAARIYESLGFRPAEHTAAACRRPDR